MNAHNFPRVSPDAYKVSSSSASPVARSSVAISDSMVRQFRVNVSTICLAARCTMCAMHLRGVGSYSECQTTHVPHTTIRSFPFTLERVQPDFEVSHHLVVGGNVVRSD